jgi:imidazolonepropionase-like amidohydrolase
MPDELVIQDVTVISPELVRPLEHVHVLIRSGRIVEVSDRPLTARRTIDGNGRFLVPGLIDSHVHLFQVPGMSVADEAANRSIATAARNQTPRSYLYFGFTTVIDIAGDPNYIAEWNAIEVRPDAYFCGGASLANGYSFNSFETTPYFLYDERQADDIPAHVDPANHAPAAVVERIANDGAICVKTFYEPGFGPFRNLPTPTNEMIQALVAAAHADRMPVLIHANSKSAHEFAVAAGTDIAAHGIWNGLPDIENSDEVTELLRSIVDNDMGFQPTLQVLHGLRDLFDSDFLGQPGVAHSVPGSLIDWYRTDDGGWFRDEVALDGIDADNAADQFAPTLQRRDEILSRLASNDARLLFGSDTPSAPTYANPPGFNGLLEMRAWINAGVSEEQLLRALTIENAEAFGLGGDIGTVEEGKIAHLLLLSANPLQDVSAYDSIETVFLAGRPIDRGELSALNSIVR